MLAEVLDAVDQGFDLVILDRGFFDALVWLELQRNRQQVTGQEAQTFEQFVLLERWRRLVDVTVVMSVSPAEAMLREQHGRLIPRRGSVMHESTLAMFNDALVAARRKHGTLFQLEDINSTEGDAKDVAARVVANLIARIKEWVDPLIRVVPRDTVKQVFSGKTALRLPPDELPTDEWARLASSVRPMKRSAAEADREVVQLVAGGVATRGGVFVFDRTLDQRRVGEYGQNAVWRGGHLVESSDDLASGARKTVIERFQTDLHLSFEFEPQPLGIVWLDGDDKNPRAAQHLGILFEVHIADENVAQSLVDKEFRTGRGHPATSRFTTLEELRQMNLESWSALVVSEGWLGAG